MDRRTGPQNRTAEPDRRTGPLMDADGTAKQPIVDLICSGSRRSMGLWARTMARMRLFCNCLVVIGDW
jgi:hypothetical protein